MRLTRENAKGEERYHQWLRPRGLHAPWRMAHGGVGGGGGKTEPIALMTISQYMHYGSTGKCQRQSGWEQEMQRPMFEHQRCSNATQRMLVDSLDITFR